MFRILAIACSLILSTAANAQTSAAPSPEKKAIDALVLQVSGMRMKVRAVDGREFWVTLSTPAGADKIGKRLHGMTRVAGDTLQVSDAVFVTD